MSNLDIHQISLIGLRPTNEDVELFNLNLLPDGTPINHELAPIDCFIICDGHGGRDVARLVAPYLIKKFMLKNFNYPLDYNVIKSLYDNVQLKLAHHKRKVANGCGCTTLVVIRYIINRKQYVQVINIGDCRVIVSRQGLAIAWSKDHKPDWPDEKKRIMEVNKAHNKNEQIHFSDGAWRIGDLSVSRSFGDTDNTPYVTHVPDVFNYNICDMDEFIIIGCDGLWDVINNEDAINFVRDYRTNNLIHTYGLVSNKQKSNNIAEQLATYALSKGSTDNISIFIIFLK